ncbi:MAG TPA: hypothetical protein VF824_17190 [Thermoanaerobaculia bacterium]|jgi:hypothetical protein
MTLHRWQLALLLAGALLLGALATAAVLKRDAAEEPEAETPQRVDTASGATELHLQPSDAAHIVAEPVQSTARATAVNALGTVLDVRELIDARGQLLAARAQAENANARLASDRAEVSRLRLLNADDKNVSDRVLQEAEAQLRADEAAARAASATISAASESLVHRWGRAAAADAAGSGREVSRLAGGDDALVEVGMPLGVAAPPPSLRMTAANGAAVTASLLGPMSVADARFAGRSWLYLARDASLAAGTTLQAPLESHAATGAFVPASAVVYDSGRAWIFVKNGSRYRKTPLSVDAPVSGGYFDPSIAAGTLVVTRGAQQLLSEEARPKEIE